MIKTLPDELTILGASILKCKAINEALNKKLKRLKEPSSDERF